MNAILRTPVLRVQGDSDFQRLHFLEDLSGNPGEITYTPYEFPKPDILRYAYLLPDGTHSTGVLVFTPDEPSGEEALENTGIEPSDGTITDLSAAVEFAWPADADFDNIRITAYQGGQKYFRTEQPEVWTNPYTANIAPPDPTKSVQLEIHLHRGTQCETLKLELLPAGQDVYEAVQKYISYDVEAGVTTTYGFDDLINTDGPDIGEFVLIEPPRHGHAVFPAPVHSTEGHPILVPARQGVVTIGSDGLTQFTLSEYARIRNRGQGNWQDWPLGLPAEYTVDAVLGSVVAVRQASGGTVLELSA